MCDENGDGGWDFFDAAVVCAQLGLEAAAQFNWAAAGDPSSRIWMMRPPECDGTEPKLAECDKGRDFKRESESWTTCRAPPHLVSPSHHF